MNKYILTAVIFLYFIGEFIHRKQKKKVPLNKIKDRINISLESNSQWYLNDSKSWRL